jgi:hypothetical protein
MPPVRRRNQFHQLSPFERGHMIGLREVEFSYRQITAQVKTEESALCYVVVRNGLKKEKKLV